jgi:hypothetical protein
MRILKSSNDKTRKHNASKAISREIHYLLYGKEEETPIYYNVSTMRDIEEAYKEYKANKEY